MEFRAEPAPTSLRGMETLLAPFESGGCDSFPLFLAEDLDSALAVGFGGSSLGYVPRILDGTAVYVAPGCFRAGLLVYALCTSEGLTGRILAAVAFA